jgi:cysteine synthase A
LGTFVDKLDGALHIADEKSIAMVYDVLDTEGLYLGASSGYQSRLFSKKWLQSKGLTDAIPEHLKRYAVLD